MEITYYSAYNTPKTQAAPAGNKEEPVYTMTIDKEGNKKLIKTGMTNIYEIIQEHLEQSKIENIIRRATEGDPYALNVINGQYIDATDLPTSLAEAQSFVIRAKGEFDQLPINIRRSFDMSAEKYIAAYGTSNWLKIMGINTDSTKPNNAALTDQKDQPKKNSTDSTKKGEK